MKICVVWFNLMDWIEYWWWSQDPGFDPWSYFFSQFLVLPRFHQRPTTNPKIPSVSHQQYSLNPCFLNLTRELNFRNASWQWNAHYVWLTKSVKGQSKEKDGNSTNCSLVISIHNFLRAVSFFPVHLNNP